MRSGGRGNHQLPLAYADGVTDAQLAPTASLALLVDPNRLDREKRLCFAATVDNPHKLQQLAQPDCLISNLDLALHGLNLSVMSASRLLARVWLERPSC
jgi:hypothetical protein